MTGAITTIEQLVSRSRQLYSLPAVAVKVLQLTNDPRVDAGKLKACIEHDPALTTKVLRVVNSALFGLSRQVSDLNQALALLGTKPLKLLVLGFSLPDRLFAGVAGDVLQHYWNHTLTRAVAAREISQRFWRTAGDEAFIAGLLQDVGVLVLIQQLGRPYVDFHRKVKSEGIALAEAQRETLGFDHAELTARLLTLWGLPKPLTEAISAPQDVDALVQLAAEGNTLPQVLHLSELLAELLAEGQKMVLPKLLKAGERYCQLSVEQLVELVDTLQDRVEQLAEVLSLELPCGLAYGDVLDEAHRQLVNVASETAEDAVRSQCQPLSIQLEGPKLEDEVRSLSQAVAKFRGAPSTASQPSADRGAQGAPARLSTAKGDRPAAAPQVGPRAATFAHAAHRTEESLDPGLLGRLTAVVGACRQARCELSLLLVEVDHYDQVVFSEGAEEAKKIVLALLSACQELGHADSACSQVGDARFAVILPGCDRRLGVQLANDLVRRAGQRNTSAEDSAISISVGISSVALPPRNFPPGDLLDSAARCLRAAQSAGGNSIKSIEIY